MRRTGPVNRHRQSFTFGQCTFAPGRGELRRGDELIKLTSGELALLRVLAQKPGEAISRAALAEQTSAAMVSSIDEQVARYRKKIKINATAPN
ncbi:MAG: winged helix-turn-helix domain-containing protein, partial [Amphiplicatus sp.]